MADPIRVVAHDHLEAGDVTPGMTRRLAFGDPGVWVGEVRTHPSGQSGWHHHGEHTTYGRVVEGTMRFEFEGGAPVDARAGDYFLVPPHTVHRESNPSDEAPSVALLVRMGSGETVFNVDAPGT